MLKSSEAVLVVVDAQERLLPFIHEAEDVVAQIVRLIRGFQILEAPVIVTEQYRKGLGPTESRIIEALTRPPAVEFTEHDRRPTSPTPQPVSPAAAQPFDPMEKMSFSCAAHPPFLARVEELKSRQIVLCGIEAHVCVLQTALELRERGYEVYLAADAVSSRSPRNVEIARRRMEQAGVLLTSCEMAVFEMLHVSGTPQFKSWSRVIR